MESSALNIRVTIEKICEEMGMAREKIISFGSRARDQREGRNFPG